MSVSNVAEVADRYRAVVTWSHDPCSYCRRPARSDPQDRPFPTYAEALDHGRVMARNVYGSSVHHVTVETSTVTPWVPAVVPVNAPCPQ